MSERSPVPLWRAIHADPRDFFTAGEVQKSKEYQGPLQRARLISATLSFALIVGLVWGRVGPRLFGRSHMGWALELVMLLAILIVADLVIGLPVNWWKTFVHEEKWGFNRTTRATFVADQIKNVFLNVALLGGILIGIWALIHATDLWWVYSMLLLGVVITILAFLGPTVLLPLFNKLTPLQDAELETRLRGIAGAAGARISGFWVMDASKRSSRDNAAVVGLGSTQKVLLFDNILELPAEQLCIVVAHELGHWRRKHVPRTLAGYLVVFLGVLALTASILRVHAVLRWAGVTSLGDPAALPLFLVAAGAGFVVARYAISWWSRWMEREADLDALELTHDVASFLEVWRSMNARNLPDLSPGLSDRLRATHPAVFERMRFAQVWGDARVSDGARA